MIYKRNLTLPDKSFFLFGPRGTGKTTWLKKVLPDAKWYDLLKSQTYFKLLRNPGIIRQEVEALSEKSWIVIDEVQKLPVLLNEVHSLMADSGNRYKFALSGSSARKLKRLDSDLLAGRAINRKFYPLTGMEMEYNLDIDRILRFGTLPDICVDTKNSVQILEAYATNYLKEEIQQEALAKDIGSFSRFLEVASLCNAQVVNLSNIARDAGVARMTVQRYFDVLETTLIGSWLPAWKPKAKIKEVNHPKFYFFDTGIVRTLQDLLRDPVEKAETGPLFETYIYHELNAWQNVSQCGGKFYYWRTPSGSEVDFIWKRGKISVGIEVKAKNRWKSEEGKSLKFLKNENIIDKCYVVYMGKEKLKDGDVYIYPYLEFLRKLNKGNII